MPGCCSAPNCRSNYAGQPNVRVHVFPNDPVRRAAWTRAVPRKDFAPTKNTVLCEKHFVSSDYVKTSKYTDVKTGKTIEVPLKVFRLKPDAVPSDIINGIPTVLLLRWFTILKLSSSMSDQSSTFSSSPTIVDASSSVVGSLVSPQLRSPAHWSGRFDGVWNGSDVCPGHLHGWAWAMA
ncbi:hypothetical protein HPB51_028550 [Rhipicephalus microplus]|uniref:THAP-type domain-containing protein n=1 Tax=Rhipicephalus microplus TaxID=6941 RepID=A0A9J6CX12_RHIMP|nr:hypothetical protein HPB51_028550 [Rhipicephalus microplus]